MALFILVSNGSRSLYPDKGWDVLRTKNNITEIKTTVTQESTDSWILQFIASSYNPCESDSQYMKREELTAYGCATPSKFTIAQAYKADIIAVSTSDYHLAELMTSAFLSNPSRTSSTLVIFIPEVNNSELYKTKYLQSTGSKSAIVIKNPALAEKIDAAQGRVLFVPQTADNVNTFMKSSQEDLRKHFMRAKRFNDTGFPTNYVFTGARALTPTPSPNTDTRVIILDADDSKNMDPFKSKMGLTKPAHTTKRHTFKDLTNGSYYNSARRPQLPR